MHEPGCFNKAERGALAPQISFTHRSTHPMKTKSSRLLSAVALGAISTTLLVACNKPPEVASPTPPPPITLGTQVDDAVVTSSVKSALFADDLVKGLDLQVETRKGIVQLSGFVNSAADIQHAVQLVQGTSGVRSVRNDMRLK
jgi:hyperosmotically inducible protein